MYRITLDNRTNNAASVPAAGSASNYTGIIYDPSMPDLYPCTGPSGSFEIDEAGNVTFTLLPGHPLMDRIYPIESYIHVFDGEDEIFYGRVFSRSEPTLTGQVSFECEGSMCFLLDSEIGPFSVDNKGNAETRTMTVGDFFRYCINQHNAQVDDPRRQFEIGEVAGPKHNSNDKFQITSYTQTKSLLQSNILDIYGGHIRIRPKNNSEGHIIDWKNKVSYRLNPQRIRVGVNLQDQNISFDGNDIFTVIRPVGQNGIKLTVSEPDAISAEIAALGLTGNVNLKNRPIISPETMRAAGYSDFDGDYATLYSMTYTEALSNGSMYTWLFTPIRSNGTVLSQNQIDAYVADLCERSSTPAALKSNDNRGLLIHHLSGTQISQMDVIAEKAHDLSDKWETFKNSAVSLTDPSMIAIYDQETMNKYGIICKTIEFKNATTEAQLRKKAEDYINNQQKTLYKEATIQLVDMHYLDGSVPKVRIGDRFTNIEGLEGEEMVVSSLNIDFEHLENTSLTMKNHKALDPELTDKDRKSTTSSGARGRGSGSGLTLKYIHEFEDKVLINVKNLEVDVQDLALNVGHSLEVYTASLNLIASRVDTVEGLVDTHTTQIEGVEYRLDEYDASAIMIDKDKIVNVVGKFEVLTGPDGKTYVHLKDGADLQIDDQNGITQTIGTRLAKADKNAGDACDFIEDFTGSALWTQRDKITGVVGEYTIMYNKVPDPDHPGQYKNAPGKNTLVITSGGGMMIQRDNSEFGIYDSGNLTAGIICSKINGGTTTIRGKRILIGVDNRSAEDWMTDANNGEGVFAKYLTVKQLTAQEIETLLAKIGDADIGEIDVGILRASDFVTAPNINCSQRATLEEVRSSLGEFDDLYAYSSLYIRVSGSDKQVKVYDAAKSNGTVTISRIGGNVTFKESNIADITKNASNNTLTITKTDGTTITFENATQLTGDWRGNVLTVTASPQNKYYTVGFGTPAGYHHADLSVDIPNTPSLSGTNLRPTIRVDRLSTTGDYTTVYSRTVSIPMGSFLEELPVTSNGTYTPSENKLGFSSVSVNVPQTSGLDPTTVRSRFNANMSSGLYYIESYVNGASMTPISGSSLTFSLYLNGKTVEIRNASNTKILNTPTLSVSSVYTQGNPKSAALGSKKSGTTYNLTITLNDGTTKSLTVDCATPYAAGFDDGQLDTKPGSPQTSLWSGYTEVANSAYSVNITSSSTKNTTMYFRVLRKKHGETSWTAGSKNAYKFTVKSTPVLQEKSDTQTITGAYNKTFEPDSGKCGLSKVTVKVTPDYSLSGVSTGTFPSSTAPSQYFGSSVTTRSVSFGSSQSNTYRFVKFKVGAKTFAFYSG